MLVQIGSRSEKAQTETELVDLLLACHARIRGFLALGRRLALAPSASREERREAARQIHRYFTTAFPLHMVDEDELVTHHLAGFGETTDRALAKMQHEHVEHVSIVARLVEACASIEDDPRPSTEDDVELLAAIAHASAVLERHLAFEEREIFPVLRTLPRSICDQIVKKMRDRRTPR